MTLVNVTLNQVISKNITQANSFFSRLKGLMFSKKEKKSIWIKPCRSIHTFFMNYSIDVLYLDKENRIAAIDQDLKPGKLGTYYPGVESVVELPSGTVEKTRVSVGHEVKIF
ncbi:DUF192 domain-containing protein [Lederbergia citri]|uniref:DUF192 domain-containing protein n=1 Tax=Lederbergia citri TaxID=2833580 RepID=A0A942TKE1_9BACI|nr:DUF192 domain-containing protein [Lederbergia citri]MBS4197904.1 DUF192 domain-containing protein [Lederbergia citri]